MRPHDSEAVAWSGGADRQSVRLRAATAGLDGAGRAGSVPGRPSGCGPSCRATVEPWPIAGAMRSGPGRSTRRGRPCSPAWRMNRAPAGIRFNRPGLDGERAPYREEDAAHPIPRYGQSKTLAEEAVLHFRRHAVVRVSLLYGPSLVGRPTFLDEQVSALDAHRPCRLFGDEWRTPLSLSHAQRGRSSPWRKPTSPDWFTLADRSGSADSIWESVSRRSWACGGRQSSNAAGLRRQWKSPGREIRRWIVLCFTALSRAEVAVVRGEPGRNGPPPYRLKAELQPLEFWLEPGGMGENARKVLTAPASD